MCQAESGADNSKKNNQYQSRRLRGGLRGLDLLQHLRSCRGIYHDCAFRNFQLQSFRREVQFKYQISYFFDQIRLQKLFGGEVDIHCKIEIVIRILLPFAELPAGLPEIPPSQLSNETGFFRNMDKFVRTNQSSSRMLPA